MAEITANRKKTDEKGKSHQTSSTYIRLSLCWRCLTLRPAPRKQTEKRQKKRASNERTFAEPWGKDEKKFACNVFFLSASTQKVCVLVSSLNVIYLNDIEERIIWLGGGVSHAVSSSSCLQFMFPDSFIVLRKRKYRSGCKSVGE